MKSIVLVVLAAASLTDVLPQVAAEWKKKSGVDVSFTFDATSRLAKQIEGGAPGEVFFAADAEWMDFQQKAGLIDPDTRRNLLSNELVIIVPAISSTTVQAAGDVRRFHRIALAGENVPAGKYAKAAFEHYSVWLDISTAVVRGDNVRTVLKWVAAGEIEAGVVYLTDALVEPKVRVAYRFRANSHPPILYPAAVLKSAKRPDLAQDFLKFCSGSKARKLFKKAGFKEPKSAS